MSDITKRLLNACNGHPYTKINWPHRLLHDAIETITKLQRALATKDKEIERLTEIIKWTDYCGDYCANYNEDDEGACIKCVESKDRCNWQLKER